MRQTLWLLGALLSSAVAMADTVYLIDSAHPSAQSRAPKNTVMAASMAPQAQQMPAATTQWLQQHFASPLASYKVDADERGVVVFETELRDGSEVDVDGQGQWRKVERRHGVAATLLPPAVQQYLHQHHPKQRIVQIERDDDDGHIEVDLQRGTELKFDATGRLMQAK